MLTCIHLSSQVRVMFTNMQRSSQVRVCMQHAVNKKDFTFPWCSDLCSRWLQKGKR